MRSTPTPQYANQRLPFTVGSPLTQDTDVLLSSAALGLKSRRKAEALLTLGRALVWIGFALALIPAALGLPGFFLWVLGREIFLQGQRMWNKLPQSERN